ncbi:MAG: dicarboxylate/amino acid:cation symporter [Planctomycetales bacterium]|nr:dicarboxylate/amino acid:cation symporter [Planctomycetales bacterium]
MLGVLVGCFYGNSMWLASGAVSDYRDRLEKTYEQKAEFAAAARTAAESSDTPEARQRHLDRAEKLESHRPIIAARLKEVEALEAQAQANQGTAAAQIAAGAATLTEFVGDLFLQVLKLLVIPLVVTSMICGITSLGDVRKIGRLGRVTIFYYMATMAIAVLIGIVLVEVIEPGRGADDTFSYVRPSVQAKEGMTVLDTLLNVVRGTKGDPGSGMFPSNIFQAAASTNVLALIVFAIIFGAALTTIGERGRVAISFFEGANEAVMKMVHLVMWFAPVGIYGLVAWNIAKNGGGDAFLDELKKLSWYVAAVVLGLALHFVVLAGVLRVFARRDPLAYIYGILRALLTALTTASSSASLPVTMECVEENNGVSNRSASFVLPLGATINMDGTALYEAVAVIFIAQTLGMTLPLSKLVVIFFTATLAAVGAAGIPEAGLVTMVIVLQAAGVPVAGIGTILAIDWFLDRLRTTVNVYGDAVGAAVVDHQVVRPEADAA